MSAEREQIIRAAVAAMPHTNPGVADDLLEGFAMHTEADDIVAIWKAARAQAPTTQPLSQRTLDALHKEIAGFDEIQIERVPLGTKATYLQNNQPVCWLTVEHSASPGVVVSLRGITGSIEVKLGAHD